MNKKLGLLIVIAFLLTSITGMMLNVHRVNASETIVINADGSIIPPTLSISSSDNITYTLTGDINGTILVYRSDIIIDGAGYTIYGNGSNEGITNYHALSLDNVTVRNVKIDNVYRGMFFTGSSNLRIIGNTVTNASNIGIHIHDSSDCEVSDNCMETISLGNPPNGAGVHIDWLSYRNTVTGNTIKNSEQGVMVSGFSHGSIVSLNNISNTYRGIQLNNDVSYGNITWNRIIGSEYGIDTGGYNACINNSVYGNVLLDNEHGLYFPNFVNNTIYHNYFIHNTYHAFDPYNSSVNFWDHNGEGNYWGDYTTKYPNATEVDGSGIWNTPYVIDENNQDNFPLIIPDSIPPTIFILSPMQFRYYREDNVLLTFTLNESADWIGYSLNGEENMTIPGNTTLTSLADGDYFVTIYANDTAGNMGASETTVFTVDTTPPDIMNVHQIPFASHVLPADRVHVTATVIDHTSFIKQATLNYTGDNETWSTVVMTVLQDNFFNASIPPFSQSTNVTYIIMAEDHAGNTITTEDLGYTLQYQVVPEFSTLLLLSLFMIGALLATLSYFRVKAKHRVLAGESQVKNMV